MDNNFNCCYYEDDHFVLPFLLAAAAASVWCFVQCIRILLSPFSLHSSQLIVAACPIKMAASLTTKAKTNLYLAAFRAHKRIQAVSTSATNSAQVHPKYLRIKEKQRIFQEDNGLPVIQTCLPSYFDQEHRRISFFPFQIHLRNRKDMVGKGLFFTSVVLTALCTIKWSQFVYYTVYPKN